MAARDPFGSGTHIALGFLQELILHMIVQDVEHYKLPCLDFPVDFTEFPYDIVRPDKVLKVIDTYSDETTSSGGRRVRFQDTGTQIEYDLTFEQIENGKYLLITKRLAK